MLHFQKTYDFIIIWGHLEATLGNFWVTLGLLWVYDGGFGSFWGHFGHMMRIGGGLVGPKSGNVDFI